MRRTTVVTLLSMLIAASATTAAPEPAAAASEPTKATVATQKERPGRGDDLARTKAWRTFLDRANRAFFAARLPVSEVEAKIKQADERIEALAARDAGEKTSRTDITGDVTFLERAHRAFTAARMSTTDVQKWLDEARGSTNPHAPDPSHFHHGLLDLH